MRITSTRSWSQRRRAHDVREPRPTDLARAARRSNLRRALAHRPRACPRRGHLRDDRGALARVDAGGRGGAARRLRHRRRRAGRELPTRRLRSRSQPRSAPRRLRRGPRRNAAPRAAPARILRRALRALRRERARRVGAGALLASLALFACGDDDAMVDAHVPALDAGSDAGADGGPTRDAGPPLEPLDRPALPAANAVGLRTCTTAVCRRSKTCSDLRPSVPPPSSAKASSSTRRASTRATKATTSAPICPKKIATRWSPTCARSERVARERIG